MKLIQILPVNDTGFEHSPYSALSAYALHPIYARLEDFPESSGGNAASGEELAEEIARLRSELEGDRNPAASGTDSHHGVKNDENGSFPAGPHPDRIDFDAVLSGKMHILRILWKNASARALRESEKWAGENPWVRNYALFSLLKEENRLKSWTEWEKHRNPDDKELKVLWKTRKKDASFRVWLQWRLEEQFRKAAGELDAMGIALKGDIPILINEDSADLWAERSNFNLNFRAGSPDGQNWGFPIYNWDYLRSDNFHWWKNRLEQASKFYHAYRIDHVLGFFRIWAVPESDFSAWNGFFQPCETLNRKELEDMGFDEGRITWLSRAHISGAELRRIFGEEALIVEKMLEQVGSEDLFRTRPDGPGEKEAAESPLSDSSREALFRLLKNRTLLPAGTDRWTPSQNYEQTGGWLSLSGDEQRKMGELIRKKLEASEKLWEQSGRELLKMMKSDGSMLVCAEDLGAIPSSVPRVLENLGILGLKVIRWSRHWDEPGQPYIPFSDYPELSVATASVHDSSTLRGWLEEEARGDKELRRVLGLAEDVDLSGSRGVKIVLEALQKSSSLLVIHPIQDLLALETSLTSPNPADERINVPGTVQPGNWSWRMSLKLEDLLENRGLEEKVKALCSLRNGPML